MGANIVSPSHLLLVVVVLLLVFGTKKLPELGRGIGSAMREFKGGISGEPEKPQMTQTAVTPPPAPPASVAVPAPPAAAAQASTPVDAVPRV